MQPHLYQLGPNRLLNGDSIDAEQVRQLYATYQSLGGDRIELCLTDPPYGVKLGRTGSKVGALGSPVKGYFQNIPLANGDLSTQSLHSFWLESFRQVKALEVFRFITFFSWSTVLVLCLDVVHLPKHFVHILPASMS